MAVRALACGALSYVHATVEPVVLVGFPSRDAKPTGVVRALAFCALSVVHATVETVALLVGFPSRDAKPTRVVRALVVVL